MLLVGRQEGHPACKKTEGWGAGVVICLERGADLHMAQLMPLPLTVSCFSKIQIGFTFQVPAYLGSPGKGPLNGCVCVCLLRTHSFVHETRRVFLSPFITENITEQPLVAFLPCMFICRGDHCLMQILVTEHVAVCLPLQQFTAFGRQSSAIRSINK